MIELLQTLKGVRYEPIADCGHSALQEQPRRTAEILLQLRYLASGPAPDAAESARTGRGAGDGARLPGARAAAAAKGASTAGSGSRAKSVR